MSPASASFRFMLLALADVLSVRIEERRLRALHIAQARALRRELIGTARRRGVREGAPGDLGGVEHAEETDHIVLVDAVAGYAQRADQPIAAIDRRGTRKNLQAIREQFARGGG